ncbi:hypothetical protein [Rubrimonas cliftonensis]|uniref:Uncharacterized protein n=1 Tax=Rubrimonas cliftonensis TaxID=89524 RepID=A0A1H3Z0U7_9RHOB|nr:hypothetical protein [Rubrimonas cliftonensis]SEA17071.1 hypothetical protein SAMN05444370_103325 [Rubrimonas cliftonensis]
MPQPPAYGAAEVILAGQKLEATGAAVSQSSLHVALGGRGMPSTAWRAWTEYTELRGPWTPPAPSTDSGRAGLSKTAALGYANAVAAILAFGELMRDETEETHALRAAQTMRAQDDVLATSARLGRELERRDAEIATLRAELDAARASQIKPSIGFAVRGPASTWCPPFVAGAGPFPA